jgi:hypothetical protein
VAKSNDAVLNVWDCPVMSFMLDRDEVDGQAQVVGWGVFAY